ncbi:hypothetical protein ACHAXT_000494 [Thalassiosira profunda]
MRTGHLVPCIIEPLPSCAVWAGIFTGIDAAQGAPLSVRTWGFYTGALWSYHALVCPMEAIHGRRSCLHNAASGFILGYIGVSRGMLGVPFVNPYTLYSMRNPALLGGAIYGALGGTLAAVGGKPM